MERLHVEYSANVEPLLRANDQAVKAFGRVTDAAGRFVDASGRLRESNGRFSADGVRFGDAMGKMGSGLASLTSKFQAFGKAAEKAGKDLSVAISLPLALLGRQAINAYADMDALTRGLATVETNAASLSNRLKELEEVAKLPGLGFKEAIQGDIRLRTTFNTMMDNAKAAELSKRTMMAFGNALASVGGGKDDLREVTNQLTQMLGAGKLQGDELRVIAERVPQARSAILQAFGTLDTKLINSKYTVDQVVAKMVEQLEKLPKATGGIKNAFENFSDTSFRSLSKFGESIEKNLGVSEIIGKAADLVTKLVDRFTQLPAPAQKAILVFGGIAIALPPILAGLGALVTTVLPAVAAGFTALTGPVGVAVIAITGAAALIVSNWDSVKKTMVDSGVWDSVQNLVSSTADLVISTFVTMRNIVVEVWNTIRGTVVPIAQAMFSDLTAIFNLGTGLLSGSFKILAGMLTLDAGKVWSGVTDIFKSLWNGLIDLSQSSAQMVGKVFAGLLESVGAKYYAGALRGHLADMTKEAQAAKYVMGSKATNGITLPEVTVTAPNLSRFDGFNFGGNTRPGRLKIGADDGSAGGAFKKRFEDTTSMLKLYEQRLKEVDTEIENLIASGSQVPDKLRTLKSGYSLLIDDLKKKADELNNKLSGTGPGYDLLKGVNKKSTFELIYEITVSQKGQPSLPGSEQFAPKVAEPFKIFNTDGKGGRTPNKDSDQYQEMQNRILSAYSPDAAKKAIEKFNTILSDTGLSPARAIEKATRDVVVSGEALNEGLASILEQAGESALTGFGEVLGNIASGTANVSSIPQMILGVLGDAAVQLGKLAIGIGISVEAVKKAFTSLGGVGAIAAGIALVAIGTAAKNGASNIGKSIQPKGYAAGGIFSGEQTIRVGEYAGATSDPEVVGKFSKLAGMITPIIQSAVGSMAPSLAYNSIAATPNRPIQSMQRTQQASMPSVKGHFTVGPLRYERGAFVSDIRYIDREERDVGGRGIFG